MKKIHFKMGKKYLFYITAFLSGLSVMAIELGASRLMAPYFSSSQIIWTIIIGTIMIAMALGNVIGGKMADKSKTPDKLFIWLFAAATWTMLIPLFGKFIIAGISLVLSLFVTKGFLIWASLISCIVVFVFPLMVLGMVTPNLVKFAVDSLEENGKTVGIIEACNTIGSILGTFLPTFVTIPFIGTALTFVIFASVLYIVCIVYFVVRKKFIIRTASVFAVALTLGILSANIGVAFWNDDILYEGESIYNYLRVEENDRSIILSTNVLFGVQSIKQKGDRLTGMYYDYALCAPVIKSSGAQDTSLLILGLGTGTYATQCQKYFNIDNIDGVEIDQKIIDLANEYFDLPECVNTYTQDGRAFISATDKKYDVIMVDAYQDITIPFQMSSVEFFTLVKEHLTNDGVMVVNMNMYSYEKGNINDYLCGTIASVFENAYICPTKGTNAVLFATDGEDAKQRLAENVEEIDNDTLYYFIKGAYNSLSKVEKSEYILTDDKAPVELLGMQVLDNMIADELEYMKEAIKGKSFKEIFNMLINGEII